MSKELVKRLRNFDDGVTPTQEAADCIEALTAERDMATEGWAEATRLIDVARQQYGAEKSRAEAAEAKLAKAVEALREIAAEASVPVHTWKNGINFKKMYEGWRKVAVQRINKARATLEEIEGEKG
jgi:hypothetical protein